MMARINARPGIWPGALAAALAAIVLVELVAPGDLAAPLPAPPENATAAAAQPDAASLADAWSSTILARPIFRPDRRPPQAAAAAAGAPPRLTAIVVTAAGARAIFVDDAGGVLTVQPGGTVAGQKVKSITAAGVTLLGPTGTTVLRPQFGAAPAAPADPDAGSAPNTALPPSSIQNNMDRF